MAQPAPTFSAVSSLLQLLSDVRGQGDVGSAAEPRPEEELGDLFSQGHKLKQQLLAARTARLCRFLELTSAAGVTPHAATQRGSGARRRLGQRIDSAEEADSRPRGTRKAHWSPVSILEGAGACSNACSTPGSSRSVDSEASAASLPHTPVPYALEEWRQVAAAGAPKPAPPPPPLPPPPGVLRLGVRVMPPTALDISSPLISPRGRLVSQCKPAAPVQRQQQQLLPTGAAPHPPPPPPPPPLPKAGSKAAGLAPPPRPPPPPPPGGVASLPRVAVPEPEVGAAAGTRRTPPPPRQPGPLPAHLAAPPPREGVQRRPIHFDGVRPVQAQGSLWEQPPPEQEAADPAEAVRVDALDRLFAKHTLAPPDARDGSTAGSPAGSPRRPSVGAPAARRGSGHDEGSGSLGQAVSSADSEVCSVCGSPGRLVSRGGLSLARNKRPITRIFTGGRKAVNIEILLRKLGSPTTVAQAIAELDTKRLQVAILRELQANMPDATELEALHAYLDTGGDPSQLGRAEQLFVALRGTARLEQKLQVLVFAGSLQELGGEVTEPLGRIVVALDQLRCSAQLRLLLHTALRLGNALNAGRKAPQRGIRLAHLRKLADTKSLDGRTTLMHYLVALMLESVPGALLLGKAGSQCGAVPGARHWSFAELEAGLERLSAGIDMVWQEQRAACGGEQRQLGALAGQASALVQRAQQLLAAARQKAADTLRYLGDDVAVEPGFSATEPRRMLGDMGDFLLLLHKAHADGDRMAVCLETLRQQQEEAAEQGAPAAAGGEGASGVAAQEQAVP